MIKMERWTFNIIHISDNIIRYSFILFFILLSDSALCQTAANERKLNALKIDTLEFISNKKSIINLNFEVYRNFFNDSIYEDVGILCQDTSINCSLRFYVTTDNELFVWTGSKWHLIFDKKANIFNAELEYNKKEIKPIKKYSFNNDEVIAFYCRENIHFTTDDNVYYYSMKYGIYMVKNTGMTFVRNDVPISYNQVK